MLLEEKKNMFQINFRPSDTIGAERLAGSVGSEDPSHRTDVWPEDAHTESAKRAGLPVPSHVAASLEKECTCPPPPHSDNYSQPDCGIVYTMILYKVLHSNGALFSFSFSNKIPENLHTKK